MVEHGFSVRLKTKEHVLNISMSEDRGDTVLIEGVLGELECIEMIENSVLRITGSKGTLMIDLTEDELNARKSVNTAG